MLVWCPTFAPQASVSSADDKTLHIVVGDIIRTMFRVVFQNTVSEAQEGVEPKIQDDWGFLPMQTSKVLPKFIEKVEWTNPTLSIWIAEL